MMTAFVVILLGVGTWMLCSRLSYTLCSRLSGTRKQNMDLQELLTKYQPGSYDIDSYGDTWTWVHEYGDIGCPTDLIEDIRVNGIREPILLGDDGRVWDGHHRIIAAWHLDMKRVPVKLGHYGPRRPVLQKQIDVRGSDDK